jgi:hypothetical protein
VGAFLREGEENSEQLKQLLSQNDPNSIKVDYLSYDWNINVKD